MDVYAQIVVSIIRHQEAIIGPVAVEQAENIPNLELDWDNKQVTINGDPKHVINQLVRAYKDLFGQIAVEVSKDSSASLLSQLSAADVPLTLK